MPEKPPSSRRSPLVPSGTADLASLGERVRPPGGGPQYAELLAASNFSFLRGASHPEELAAAAAALGQELTLPEVAQSVVLTRTSGRASAMPPAEKLEAFAATGATLAIHLSIHTIDKVVATLLPHYGADCPAAVIYRASWPEERVIRATLGTLAAEVGKTPIERTALILVGKVLQARDFRDSALYDASYQRRFRGRGQ